MEQKRTDAEKAFDREMQLLRASRNRRTENKKGTGQKWYDDPWSIVGVIVGSFVACLSIVWVVKAAETATAVAAMNKIMEQGTQKIQRINEATYNPITNYQQQTLGVVKKWQEDEQKKIDAGQFKANYYQGSEVRTIPPQTATACQEQLGNEINEALVRCTHGYRAEFDKKTGQFIRYIN